MKELKIAKTLTIRTKSVDAYLKMIQKQPMISPEEEVKLAQRIHKGDQQALDQLVMANLRFAFSIAKQYQNRGLDLMDLIEEANLGLITAAQKFDETRGFKFISYAVWWIRQSILFAIAEQGNIIRKPQNLLNNISKINQAFSKFEQENFRSPSISELSEVANLDEIKINTAMRHNNRSLSVDSPIGEDEGNSLLDTIASEGEDTDKVLMQESLAKDMDSLLNTLPYREKYIICMFYGIGTKECTLEEIGNHFNLSRERVRQIKESTIRRLRDNKANYKLRNYIC